MNFSPRVAEVLERLQWTRWKYYNLHPQAAEVLALLARVSQAKRVVEVGTSNGYSAIVLGAVVRGVQGRVFTIERDGEVAEEAKANIAEAGLQDVVTVLPGSAYKILRDLEGPWDLAFLDATKQEYVGYLERILPKLAVRALLVADNMLSHAEELGDFRSRVATEPRLDATILPVGTGLLVGLYQQEPSGDLQQQPAEIPSMRDLLAAVAPAIIPAEERRR